MAFANQEIIDTGSGHPGAAHSEPLYATFIRFDGDSAYPTGGTLNFQQFFRTLCGQTRTVQAVVPQDCGNYVPVYIPGSPDKLKVYLRSTGAEAAPGSLAATKFNLLVISN
jgi:hypothetical protein